MQNLYLRNCDKRFLKDTDILQMDIEIISAIATTIV